MIENIIEVISEIQKISFIVPTPYKIGQWFDIKWNDFSVIQLIVLSWDFT